MAINCAETNKVRLASYMLKDQADTWWRAALRTTFAGQKDHLTWDEFLVAFRDEYFLEHIQDLQAQEFLTLVQGTMTVMEYHAKFTRLEKFTLYISEDEKRRAKKFIYGLNHNIRQKVVPQRPRTLADAVAIAAAVEEEYNYFMKNQKGGQKSAFGQGPRQSKKRKFSAPKTGTPETKTAKVAVTAATPAQTPQANKNQNKIQECTKCGRPHKSNNCMASTRQMFQLW